MNETTSVVRLAMITVSKEVKFPKCVIDGIVKIKNKTSKLTYTKEKNIYKISFNNTNLGTLVKLEDGYYNWLPCDLNGGCLSSWVLKDIYNKLEVLNKEWNEEVKRIT